MLSVKKHFTIYSDPAFYSAFPAVVNLGNGRIITAFRRAPNYHGMPGVSDEYFMHGDILSQLVYCISNDYGQSWSDARLLYSPPRGGSQDGGLFFDGKTLYANSFTWDFVPEKVAKELANKNQDEFVHHYEQTMAPAGSFVMSSSDLGDSWQGPYIPEALPGNKEIMSGMPLRIHNRGNIVKLADGTLLLCGQALGFRPEFNSAIVLYKSFDEGKSWNFFSYVTEPDGVAVHEEPCLYITSSGTLRILIRTHKTASGTEFERARLSIAHSPDAGKSWSDARLTSIHAEPASCFNCGDGKVIISYGYRKEPFGVRIRVCDEDLDNIEEAHEYIIREDAGNIDTGYPWVCMLEKNRFLVSYYVNKKEYLGASRIEGTVFDLN